MILIEFRGCSGHTMYSLLRAPVSAGSHESCHNIHGRPRAVETHEVPLGSPWELAWAPPAQKRNTSSKIVENTKGGRGATSGAIIGVLRILPTSHGVDRQQRTTVCTLCRCTSRNAHDMIRYWYWGKSSVKVLYHNLPAVHGLSVLANTAVNIRWEMLASVASVFLLFWYLVLVRYVFS